MLAFVAFFFSCIVSSISQSCLSDPSQDSCVDYNYPDDKAVDDIESVCVLQNNFQCKQKDLCDKGLGHGQYCSPFSILKSMCTNMPSSITGCRNFQKLCHSGSVVENCNIPVLPLPSWEVTQDNVNILCKSVPDGCTCQAPECDLLDTYSTLCKTMTMDMEECQDWKNLCNYIPDWSLCTALSCITNPSLSICAHYSYPDIDAKNDINLICNMMPSMAECTIKSVCENSLSNDPFCNPFSLLKSACSKMSSSKLCTNYTTMCLSNLTNVHQCKAVVLPLPTTASLLTNIDSICSFMDMEGCAECGGGGRTLPQGCDLLMVYSTLCKKMPNMVQCEDWNAMCTPIPDWTLCNMDNDDGQYPGMAMYFHLGYKEYIFFKSWVPQNGLEFFGACVFLFLLCIIHKALRQIQTQTILWQSRPRQISEPHKNHIRLGDRLILYVGPIRWKDLVQSLLTFFESMLGLIIMLLVMTFNFWILLAVGLGYAVGGLIFARINILEPQPILEDDVNNSLENGDRESLNFNS